jgi:hypothetical protein
MKKPAFPLTIKSGNSKVKIYRYKFAGYKEFKVGYYSQGKRKLETFSTFEKARIRAGQINESVNKGESDALLLAHWEFLSLWL